MKVVQLDQGSSSIDDLLAHSDFVISVARDAASKKRVLAAAQASNVPTIQTQLHPWTGKDVSKGMENWKPPLRGHFRR